MNIFQFFRVLWAYRTIVLFFVAVSFVTAVAFVQIAEPRYEAQSRVMLDIVKPDPVTGQVISSPFVRAYTKTQIELVQDYQVAGRAVDILNWQSNPQIMNMYKNRDKGTDLDFKQWAADMIVEGTSARLVEGSNILEITYASTSPLRARDVSEALRKAYVDLSLQNRQQAAQRNAEWYEAQGEKIKGMLLQAEKAKADFERQTGIVLQDGDIDVETARLKALAGQGATPIVSGPAAAGVSPGETQLAQLEAELVQANKVFGPNHPQLIEMRRRRDVLAEQVRRERTVGGNTAASAASAAAATGGMLEAQKAKVMAQREQVERLKLMQADVNLRREQYGQAATRAAQLRQEAEISVAGATPLGTAVTPQSPVFPDKLLIVGGSIPVGLGLGLLIGLLLEFAGRRVRGTDDMVNILGAPVLGVIEAERPPRSGWRSALDSLRLRRPTLKPQAMRA